MYVAFFLLTKARAEVRLKGRSMVPRANKTDEGFFESRLLNQSSQDDLRSYRHRSLDWVGKSIPARSAIVARLHEEMERRSGSLQGLSLIFVAIQRVLLRNDTYGSPAEGQVLHAVAKKLQRSLRATDFLARSGDHGLTVFLPRTSMSAANIVATRLQEAVNTTEFYCESVAFKVRVGVAVAAVQAGDTVETILDRADSPHYQSE